jgi:hypothetical protein
VGLAISVGNLAFALQNDPEAVEWLREGFREVNRVLDAHGLPRHAEPESLTDTADRPGLSWDRGMRRGLWRSGMPYSWLHYLRRAVAFARQAPGEFRPLEQGDDPTADERLDYELSVVMDSHVICHSDCEGFYVPIDFPEPLYDDRDQGIPGGILGSSQRALTELVLTAPMIGIVLRDGELSDRDAIALGEESEGSHPYWIERHAWLYFSERLRQSIASGSALVWFIRIQRAHSMSVR